MKYTLLIFTPIFIFCFSGCDFVDGIIAGAVHHVILEVEFDTLLNSDVGTEDFCEHFGIDVLYCPLYTTFQAGAWAYLDAVLNP